MAEVLKRMPMLATEGDTSLQTTHRQQKKFPSFLTDNIITPSARVSLSNTHDTSNKGLSDWRK